MPLVEVVRAFRGLRALVIGDVMLDSYFEGDASRLCPEGPVPVVRKTGEQHLPGGAANSAANVVALGAETALLGLVGRDQAGAALRDALRRRGIDDGLLLEDSRCASLHKMRVLANGQYVVRFDSGDTSLSAESEALLLDRLDAAYSRSDVVIISDYGYGVLSDRVLEHLRALRREAGAKPLVIDSKNLRRFRGLEATMVTPNHCEAALAVDPSLELDGNSPLERVEKIGRRLLDMVGARCVAVTLAERGALVVDRNGGSAHVPAHPVAGAQDVGAGDSFTAALALALGAGASPNDAVAIGVEAAGIAVRRDHTAAVQHQELLQRVSLGRHSVPSSEQDLAASLERERAEGRAIVFTNGVFDILHAGHVQFLREAKSLGDLLVVGVNSDASARRLKGPARPINSERDRLSLVAALDSVDHVVLFDEDTPARLIRALRPDIHVKGGDYSGEDLPEADAVSEVGGRLVILPLAGTLSTSSVIDRILAIALEEGLEVRA